MTEIETLSEARKYLRENWEKGVLCPCCTQRVQLYRHKVNAQITKCLIQMYRLNGDDWVHVLQDLKPSNRMYSLARFWGLIEPKGDTPEDDKKSSGYWRLTSKGVSFVLGQITIPKYAYIFNDKVYRFSPDQVTIREALTSKFSYHELLGS